MCSNARITCSGCVVLRKASGRCLRPKLNADGLVSLPDASWVQWACARDADEAEHEGVGNLLVGDSSSVAEMFCTDETE